LVTRTTREYRHSPTRRRCRAVPSSTPRGGTLNARWRGPRLGPAAALSFLSLARAGTRVLVAGGFAAAGHARPGVVALLASDGALDRTWTTPREWSEGDWEVRVRSGRAFVATACAAPPCLVALSAASGRPLRRRAGIAAIGETGCVNDIAFERGIVYFTGGIAAAHASDGSVVGEFVPTGSCADYGHAVAAAGGRIFVGGDTCSIAAFASSSGTQLWAGPRQVDATTNVLLAVSGRVYVGGAFRQLAGAEVDGLAALDGRTGRPVAAWPRQRYFRPQRVRRADLDRRRPAVTCRSSCPADPLPAARAPSAPRPRAGRRHAVAARAGS
jgi:hypothetical protein